MDIPKQFDPKNIEESLYRRWEDGGLFEARPGSGKPPFVIVIPPPNVTGILHAGHAMFVTLQDILIRWKRMQGFDTLWLPGTDHAGIATQMVVSKELEKQGLKRDEMGREAFLEKVWEWRREKGDTILLQLKRLGASCDWSRTRFTLDADLSRAVRKAFVDLYREGLIYRGEFMINWCTTCGTAISDLEVDHEERQGNLWHIRYPLEGGAPGEGLVVATTRPETLLGDTAVAVNPSDPRYRDMVGRTLILPVLGRRIPVIADSVVDLEFGTGAVKITPAHDPNDFETGKRHSLAEVVVIDTRGMMTGDAGPYAGKDRFVARKAIIKQLEAEGLLVKAEPHRHAVGHCQRCRSVVEPSVSKQWFLRIEPLATPAREAVERGDVRIVPDHWRKVYLNWMAEIHDWCISRQLWWGHRIPAFSCPSCQKAAGEQDPDRSLVSMEDLTACPYCGGNLVQDEDVLDTWFSSQLWPFSTLGWPEDTEEMRRYYPTTVMETGYDILFFWVARMIMAGLKFTGQVPFRDVFLHGLVRDAQGRKMSKTLGNVIDPLELIDKYGADPVRFTLAILCVPGTDVPLDTKRMEGYAAFANKLWNAARFVLMQVGESVPVKPEPKDLGLWDRWILSQFDGAARTVNEALGEFKFYEAADALYHFVWHRFCDWYVEASKVALSPGAQPQRREATRWTLVHVLDGTLKLLHPFMPFITEDLWGRIPGTGGSIMIQPYPAGETRAGEDGGQMVELLVDLVTRARNIRAERGIAPAQAIEYALVPKGDDARQALRNSMDEFRVLARASSVDVLDGAPAGDGWVPTTSTGYGIYLRAPEKAVDRQAEHRRIEGELKKVRGEREKFAAKLSNPAFIEKAPPDVVAKNRGLLEEFDRKAAELECALAGLH
jgi:valyl-tRNA synthetase